MPMRPWTTATVRRASFGLLALLAAVLIRSTFERGSGCYRSWWFVLLLALLGIAMLPPIVRRGGRGIPAWGARGAHAGVAMVLIGAAVTAGWARRGEMTLREGEVMDSYTTAEGVAPLGFSVALDRFAVERYAPRHRLSVLVAGTGREKELDVEPGRSCAVAGSGYTIAVDRFLPDFVLDRAMRPGSRSDEPNNPALLVTIRKGGAEESRWLFADYPDFPSSSDAGIRLRYSYVGGIKGFTSMVKIIDGGGVAREGAIEVNRPLRHRGYSFYQERYDPADLDRTVLGVVRDPGVPIVYAGFLLLNLGVVLSVSGGAAWRRARGGP